jgi:hypothetical protein
MPFGHYSTAALDSRIKAMKKYIFTICVLIMGLNISFDVVGFEQVIEPDEQLRSYSEPSPDNKWEMGIDCNKEGCSVYAQTENKKVWVISPGYPYPKTPNVTWLSNEIAEVYLSCGMSCGGAKYFSTVHGVSPCFQLNLATNIKRNLILTLELSDKQGTPAFFVRNLFRNKGSVVAIIKRDIYISFFKEGVDASFNPDGTITIRYIDRKTKKDRVETIAEPFH